MITDELNTKIWIISDTHLIADSLHDSGQAFSRMQKTSQGKDLYYQENALRAFVKYANEKQPAAIVVTGDVTFNGERTSAEKFASIFKELTSTKLLVIPGNHDIFDGWAREFRGKKQFFAGQISPMFWKMIFSDCYNSAISCDSNSLAYSIQLNPDYLFLMLDSNYYGKEETTCAPRTSGYIKKDELKWIKEQLIYAQENHLRPIMFMHHNLYAHNPVINHSYVIDNTEDLRKLCRQFQVKLLFSGHIHAQNIIGPQDMTPTTEIVTSSFCSTDQGFGELRLHHRHLTYIRKSFEMKRYLSKIDQEDYTLTHFHDYLKNLQLGTLAAPIMQKELRENHDPLNLVTETGRLFAKMNYNFYTGQNHLKSSQLSKIHHSQAYQTLIKQHPKIEIYLKTLYDTTDHSNLQVKINY